MSLYDHFFNNYTSEQLHKFIKLCGGPSSLKRKGDRARYLAETLSNPQVVRRLWGEMDDLSRKALAAAFHNDGVFNKKAFRARYGKLPTPRSLLFSWSRKTTFLDLFLHDGAILPELMPLLADIVPPPEKFQLSGLEEAPEEIRLHNKTIELLRMDREIAGLHDLSLYLTLVSQGKLRLSSSTGWLTPKGVMTLLPKLQQGDLFDDVENAKDAIFPFGLNEFCIAANLVTYKGNLTPAGSQFLSTQDPDLLLEAFETWVEEGRNDELERIKAIKGKRARGVRLTLPSQRRENIIEALSWSPTGVWISIFDFYRAIKIWELDFDLEAGGLNRLFIGHRYGGKGWYEPWASEEDAWMLTNGLYINLIIMEYLAALGAVDIVYTYPEYGTFPARAYYYDEYQYSRYDGLLYFRINPLGAFLLGQAAAYEPSQTLTPTLFSVLPTLEVDLLQDTLTPAQQAQLDQITEVRGNRRFLSRSKLLAILDDQPGLEAQRAFLLRHNRGPLPKEALAWLDEVETNSRALRIVSKSLTIKVRSAELAQQILADPKLSKIARPLDAKTLVIPASRETAFRSALREMGYGLVRK